MAEPGAFDPLMKALGYAGGEHFLVRLGHLTPHRGFAAHLRASFWF